ncbi:NADH:flavin oxidoreductase/NADH oxidase [Paenibacillus sp. MMS20-IR301]|uniref:NADH:flavin oxidoreductase/NADH oxidase n=1 Tax=Paenibacillus sp. MMS20-IR301 TaxID=2895946 RepID=UPI0028E8B4DF|nr:NADH:flavin oxidoreductase/NADH oxidase [Paenibacillus sp. MMS20-IR301]WNS44276.1 NADH:flavin oxidoreductase/NADH oxidase [Paenibacillus sp. MMS20-IR301]
MKNLFTPYEFKGLQLKNRVVMPPMCQYSVTNKDGIATDWHYNHYVSRAVGGTGLIIIEMADVEPDGRITDYDLGLWSDEQIPALKRIVDAIHAHGAKVGIQVAHAGRKAEDAPVPVSSSAIPFDADSKTPRALTTAEVKEMVGKFGKAVERAVQAGFDVIELHGAHGYLIHQFHSPLTNQRTDEYGQDLNLFGKEVIAAAKSVMPADMPLIMRISAQEYVEGGYGIAESLEISRAYKEAGADIFHISAGGEGPIAAAGKPGTHAAYQVPLARSIKQELNVPVIAVGRLDEAVLADAVIGNEEADLIAVGRGMLRNPYWTLEAGVQLGKDAGVPKQYTFGFPRARA